MDEDTPQATDETVTPAPIETPAVDEAALEKERLGKEAQKRIARLTYEREEARREVARLKAAAPVTEPDFDAKVKQSAADLVAAEQFDKECNATFEKGIAEFPDFYDTVTALQKMGMADNRDFLDAVNDLPNGAAILHHLGDDPAEAARLFAMKPAKMAIKLAMLSGEIAKPLIKPISKTPSPPESIGGRASTPSKDLDHMTVEDYAARQADRRKNRR